MKMRLVAVAALIALLGGQVWAAETATISVTVALEETISVSLDSDTWDIGAIALSGSNGPETFTAANDGNVAIDLDVKGTNGAGGWTLAVAAGADAFRVAVTDPAINLTTVDQVLATNLAKGGNKAVAMTYHAPTSDTKGGGVDQSFSVTVSASKYVP